jgi:hypothetical protein
MQTEIDVSPVIARVKLNDRSLLTQVDVLHIRQQSVEHPDVVRNTDTGAPMVGDFTEEVQECVSLGLRPTVNPLKTVV